MKTDNTSPLEKPSSQPSLQVTKAATRLACVFFPFAVLFTPGYGSSLGMPWPFFWCTSGMMLVSALVSLLGYVTCKERGEGIGVFYFICPLLLCVAFVVCLNLYGIVHAILHYEGVV